MTTMTETQDTLLESLAAGIGGVLKPLREDDSKLHNPKLIFIAPFTTILVRVGGSYSLKSGRISLAAYHDGRNYERPEITISETRPIETLIKDIKRRLLPEAIAYCRKVEKMVSENRISQIEQRVRIESVLEAVGSSYDEAISNHNDSFSGDGFTFRSYNIKEDSSCIEINASTPCMKMILAILKQEREMKKKAAEAYEAERLKSNNKPTF